MREIEKAVEAMVRQEEDARAAAARAEHAKRALDPNDWYGKQAFKEERQTTEQRDALVKGVCLALFACKQAELARGEMKGYSQQTGGHPYSNDKRPLDEPCCSPKTRHGVWVDTGISMTFQGHAGLRLSGDPSELRSTAGATGVPAFVRVLAPGCTQTLWNSASGLVQADYDALCARYDALVAELEPAADRVAEKHSKKLEKSRERAKRPEVVARREAEARARGRDSLSRLLGGPTCKGILDKWGPEDLLTYLKLCQKHEYVLKELMRWSGQNPLGSKAIELEDVTTALEMAKVRDVMDS